VNARKIAVLSAGLIAASACGSGQTAAKASAVSLVSGNGQTAKAGAPLPASLVVKVTDSSGAPIAGFPIAWSSTSGAVYRVQYKDNLTNSVWNALTPDLTATGSLTSKSDPIGSAQRFYRVLLVQ